MRKNILLWLVMLLPMFGLMSSCSNEEDIVFEHEKTAFALQADKILLETILPSTTAGDEDVYIVGAFNGMNDSTVIGNAQWLVNMRDSTTGKRGIYIDPKTFVDGKTLADGYHFVSAKQRNEVSPLDSLVEHYDNPGTGGSVNVYVARWAAYFDKNEEPTEIKHDGFVVYVNNQTSWGNALSLYMWGDMNDLNGGWPGMQPTGTQVINGTTWTYFDMGEDNSGYAENLIFNNNGGGSQLPDYAYTIDHDIYLTITDAGITETPLEPIVQHDGYAVFVKNETGWNPLTLYMWGDTNDLNGGWPGMMPTGTQKINGVEYLYYDMGAANAGKKENLIFNNNGGGSQLADLAYTIDHDLYLVATESGLTEIPNEAKANILLRRK